MLIEKNTKTKIHHQCTVPFRKKVNLLAKIFLIILLNLTILLGDDTITLDTNTSLCYDEPHTEGLKFAGFGMFYGVTTPIRNISDTSLTDVTITKTFDGINMSIISKIAIDGESKTTTKDSDEAEENSNISESFGEFNGNLFNKGIVYRINNFDQNQTHNIYDNSMVSFDWSTIKLGAKYTKKGKKYYAVLHICGGNTNIVSNLFNIIEPSTVINSTDPIEENNSTNDIYTKVISKDFDISLIHFGDDNITLSTTFHGFVSIDVINTTNNTILQNDIWHHSFDTNIPNGRYEITNLQIPKIARKARFRINFLNWDKILADSTITCSKHSTTQGNLPGVPQCLNSETKLVNVFGTLGSFCLDNTATGAPCKSNHHGIGNPPYNKADAGNNRGYGCPLCLMSAREEAYSRDNFAIRPYSFVAFGKNQYKRAGEDFNITIKAIDEGNFTKVGNSFYAGNKKKTIGSINTYNANINNLIINSHFYQPTTAEILQMQTDIGGDNNTTVNGEVSNCPNTGIFTLDNPNLLFSNGEINASLKFSETGILDLNISEKSGSEWAKVDEDDTNDSLRYIKASSVTYNEDNISANILQLFVPYEFNTTAEYNTTTTKNWLYMYDINKSNSTHTAPQMSAFVKYKITALNKDKVIVHNYTKKCFPDVDEVHAPRVNGLKLNTTFDLFLDMDVNTTQNANISLYSEGNISNAIWTPYKNKTLTTGINQVQEWVSPFQFENGVGEAKVYFNIDRNITTALNPINITIVDTNTSTSWMTNAGSPANFNGMILNQNKVFLYGRTHAPTQTITGSDGNISLYYEVFCNGTPCNKALLPDGIDSNTTDDPRWFVNTKHTKKAGTAAQTATLQKNASHITITREANGNHPDYIGMHYDGDRGYPYKVTMQNNASSWLIYNKYNATTSINEFEVEFVKLNGIWAGVHETNTTTDTNASKRTNRRIMW